MSAGAAPTRFSAASRCCLLVPLLLLPWRLFSRVRRIWPGAPTADLADEGWTLLSAMRHHAFWALFSTFFFTAIGMYAISRRSSPI